MNTPISELLGSTPEETKATIAEFKGQGFPFFKGLVTPLVFLYSPLKDDEKKYVVGETTYPRRCNRCYDIAEHKATCEDNDAQFIRYLCTVCRDKESAPKKVKEVRKRKYVRYAGYDKRAHSIVVPEVTEDATVTETNNV